MEKNNNVIFFGNGLNRVSEGLDWKNLIKQVSGSDYIEGLSNTLQYDVAFLSKKLNYKGDSSVSPAENNFKKELADEIIKSQKNSQISEVYQKLAAMPVEDYITTNYEYCLEAALMANGYDDANESEKEQYRFIPYIKESVYSLHRCHAFIKKDGAKVKIKRIWHIHGEAKNPASIMLGYNHYGSTLGRMANYYNGKDIYKSLGILQNRLSSLSTSEPKSWIDLFYMKNIHIIGYGLDNAEIDIWWLLGKRARMNQNKQLPIINFYEMDLIDEQRVAKQKALDAFSVTTNIKSLLKAEKNELNKVFAEYYLETLEAINKTIKL